jgi:CheY-like chemotaxis protein
MRVASWGDMALAPTWSSQTKRRPTPLTRPHGAPPGIAAEPEQAHGASLSTVGLLPDSPAGRLEQPDDGGLAAARRPPDFAEELGALRVLVVDDHPLFMEFLLRQLAPYEWIEVVGCARNGRDAVTLAADAAPDAILMDLDMPLLGGIEAIRRIREWSDVPVLVLTASATERDRERALAAGALAVLPKTLDPTELAGRLAAIFAQRQGRATLAS